MSKHYKNKKPLLIVDGHYFLFRSYAIPFEFYSNKDTPLHVITTYLKLLRHTINIVETTEATVPYLVVIFDSQTQNENTHISSEYKANRIQDYSEHEDSPFIHYPFIRQVLDYCEVYNVEADGYEADDLIASLANKFSTTTKKVYIASNDSDFYQLINKNINQIKLLKRGNYEIINSEYLQKELHLKPSEYIYFKALMGDKTDNIPGIPNIGPKRSLKIMRNEYEIDLQKYQEIIDRNIKLITLNKNIEVKEKLTAYNYNKKNLNRTNKEIFENCGF